MIRTGVVPSVFVMLLPICMAAIFESVLLPGVPITIESVCVSDREAAKAPEPAGPLKFTSDQLGEALAFHETTN